MDYLYPDSKRMCARSCLMIVAFSALGLALPLSATTATSAPSDARASMLLPTNVLADVEQEVPSWILTSVDAKGEFTDTLLSRNDSVEDVPDGAVFLEAVVLPPNQAREARVPEPTTLVLLGTGLIGIAKICRSKLRTRSTARNLVRLYA